MSVFATFEDDDDYDTALDLKEIQLEMVMRFIIALIIALL